MKKKIVIFGLGSIGSRHADILQNNYDHELIAFRSSPGAGRNSMGIKEIYSWQQLRRYEPDIALIANPTALHLKTALKCAKEGINLFIEKPLSHDLKGLAELKKTCRDGKLTVYVAYCLRFHPVIKKMRELLRDKQVLHVRAVAASYLPDWRGREAYSSFKAQGGGVLLDLSHELDYVSYLFGRIKLIKGAFGRVAKVTRDSEDYADIAVTTDRGIPAGISLDYISRKNERTVKVDFVDGYLTGDLIANQLEYVYAERKSSFKYASGRNDYLREQWDYYFGRLGQGAIMNDLNEAEGLLRKVLGLKNG